MKSKELGTREGVVGVRSWGLDGYVVDQRLVRRSLYSPSLVGYPRISLLLKGESYFDVYFGGFVYSFLNILCRLFTLLVLYLNDESFRFILFGFY